MNKFLITGGAGFVGSNIGIALKRYYNCEVIVLDNLMRRGSEINLNELQKNGIKFIHGDVRNYNDIEQVGDVDFLVECSAEPSVLAGSKGSPDYVIDTNLFGAVNCAEYCRKHNVGMFFLSTSRVYPVPVLVSCNYSENVTRFVLNADGQPYGITEKGMSEKIELRGFKSYYGASKLAAELILEEYRHSANIPIIINRCGVLAGPGQFGKIDQGIISFWLASHFLKKDLSYIGFSGSGKQVRDVLHIDDLIKLLLLQLKNPELYSKNVYNVGGGTEISFSLLELTDFCAEITGNKMEISKIRNERYGDIPIYISDTSIIGELSGWKPEKKLYNILEDYYRWFYNNKNVQHIANTVI